MKRILKVILVLLGLFLVAGITLWFPYRTPGVPEWKLQVLDAEGNPAAGAQISEEWMDPIDEGMTFVDDRTADMSGTVVFPNRVLHNRLASGIVRGKPSARVLVCWQNEYGALYWDGVSAQPPGQLRLMKGQCLYG